MPKTEEKYRNIRESYLLFNQMWFNYVVNDVIPFVNLLHSKML